MGNHIIKIISIDAITHDVLRIVTNKPERFVFVPGEATHIAINKSGWLNEERPFTFTNLPANNTLEFTIKTYPRKVGVTNALLLLKPNDELILHGVFGAIKYKGEGTFIAGGAGITPFISIFRSLKVDQLIGKNMLLFANKTKADIILEDEFSALLGNDFVNILSDENLEGYEHGRITKEFLKKHVKDFSKEFYICGPPPMIKEIVGQLAFLGVNKDQIVMEVF
jgi:ferredoxin-NADP reductase